APVRDGALPTRSRPRTSIRRNRVGRPVRPKLAPRTSGRLGSFVRRRMEIGLGGRAWSPPKVDRLPTALRNEKAFREAEVSVLIVHSETRDRDVHTIAGDDLPRSQCVHRRLARALSRGAG